MSTRTLPSGWSVVKLRDVAEIVRGVSYDKEAAADTPVENYVPLLRATNIKNDRLVLEEDLVFVPKRYVGDVQVLKKWDVVVCMSSGSKHLVGKTGQLTANWKGTFGTFCAVVRFSDNVNPRFAGRYFESQEYRHFISQQSSGVNINNLRARDLADLDFPLPPLPQQQEIVDAIETQFTRLESAEVALKRVQANLRRYRAAVLKAACEGLLVPTEAELAQAEGRTYEPAATLLERILAKRRAQWQAEHPGKKYKEPAGPDVSALPELPEGWCWATVEQLLAEPLMNGHSVNTSDDGFPVLRLTAIRNGSIALEESKFGAWTAKQASAYLVKKNDFFVSRGNGSLALVGRGGLVEQQPEPVAFPDTMIRLVTSAAVNRRYLRAIWDSLLMREQIERSAKTTAGIHKINQQDISRYVLPLPPLAEQVAIAAEIEHQMSKEHATAVSLSASLRRAERLRQSILQRAFAGELVTKSIH